MGTLPAGIKHARGRKEEDLPTARKVLKCWSSRICCILFTPRVPSQLKNAGAKVGIDFTGACDRVPNTIAAHILLGLAGEISHQVQNNLQEQLFKVT